MLRNSGRVEYITVSDQEALATIGQELRFAADSRTNTLMVAGSPVYLTMVEDLVRESQLQGGDADDADVAPDP